MGRQYISILFGALFYFLITNDAFAQDVNDIAQNIVGSTARLPALISGLAYLSGILIAVTAVLKVIDHVNNPSQTPIRVPVVRFAIGGALFSLPIIVGATIHAINGGSITSFDPMPPLLSLYGLSSAASLVVGYLSFGNFSSILNSIMVSMGEIPGMVAAVGYLLGLLMAVSAIYKTRDHVENPDQVPMKDAVIRYLTAGMLFGLPTVFNAMFTTISGGGMGIMGTLTGVFTGAQFFYSSQAGAFGCGIAEFTGVSLASVTSAITSGSTSGLFTGGTLGTVLCTMMQTTLGLPGFLAALSYIIGTILGLWAVLKVRDHVNNPNQTPLHEGITRMIAAGAFFALPVVAVAIQYSVTPNMAAISSVVTANTGFNETVPSCGGSGSSTNSLDEAMVCFMSDVLGPGHVLLNFFTFVAGLIFVMIGISRITKSAQEGARGPGGIGTLATFVAGGFLMSSTAILKAVTGSLFGNNLGVATNAQLTYTGGMSAAEQAAAHNVVSAVIKFMIIIGMISFVRGIFIMRDVAEGNGQASTMAGLTHIIGGALAVNLGPLLNAVQSTLGITAFGVTFT